MRNKVAFLVLLLAPAARANEIPCGPVEGGTIALDGLLGDWQGADGVGVDQAGQIIRGAKDWSGAADLSFEAYCNYDDANLYLAINVKDEYFIRTRKAKGDDHLRILFGSRELRVFPGDLRAQLGSVTWEARGKARGIKMAEALQVGGYSVELQLSWKVVPGYQPGVPAIPGAIWVADSDSRAQESIQTIIGTAPSGRRGSFSFAQAKVDLSAFLKDKGYPASAVRMRAGVDVVGDRRPEQVLLVGRTIGIVGEGLPGGTYFYLDLPVKQPRDISWLRPVDLNGDGKAELITRYTERSKNGRRELLAVFRFNDSNKFVRSFAHEILKGQGARLITNRFTLVPRRGGKRRRGNDIVFDKPAARGFTRESYQEAPAQDCYPILLPWEEVKRRQFRFEGEEYSQL